MKFGSVPIDAAAGHILAHSMSVGSIRLRKGRKLSHDDVQAMENANIRTVVVAQLEPTDLDENSAADAIAAAMTSDGVTTSAAFTGRANLFAASAGLLRVDQGSVQQLNSVNEAITLATLPDYARVIPRQMVATIKIIPYGAPTSDVVIATECSRNAIQLHPFREQSVTLIQTRLPITSHKVLVKGEAVTRARLDTLGLRLNQTLICDHDTQSVAETLGNATGDIILILGASATSDRNDVCPAGVEAAGGRIERLGMPVDPGNLLFLGKFNTAPVVGLPGCARSPALNGADWVLERLAAGVPITNRDVADMGVGGLLKEISTRPQPRGGNANSPTRPMTEAIILAAGRSSRMRGTDKLLEEIDGVPQIARMAAAAVASDLDRVQIVLSPDTPLRKSVLDHLDVTVTLAPDAHKGMGASLQAGMAARHNNSDAVMVILADMPDLGARHINSLIAAFDPSEGRTIVQATSATGTPGHPVLFGKRFFESLGSVTGDMGARDILKEGKDFLVRVALPDAVATTDLDTPEDWENWRANQPR